MSLTEDELDELMKEETEELESGVVRFKDEDPPGKDDRLPEEEDL